MQLPGQRRGPPCAGNRSDLRLRLPGPLPVAVNALLCDAASTASWQTRQNRGAPAPQLAAEMVPRTAQRQVSGCERRPEPMSSL